MSFIKSNSEVGESYFITLLINNFYLCMIMTASIIHKLNLQILLTNQVAKALQSSANLCQFGIVLNHTLFNIHQ